MRVCVVCGLFFRPVVVVLLLRIRYRHHHRIFSPLALPSLSDPDPVF